MKLFLGKLYGFWEIKIPRNFKKQRRMIIPNQNQDQVFVGREGHN